MAQNLGNLFINGEGTINDSSGSDHVITAHGDVAVSTVEKKFGNSSVYFDGTGDYLTISDNEDWNFGTGDFTIDLWIRLDIAHIDYGGILGQSINASNRIILSYDGTNNIFWFNTRGGSVDMSLSASWDASINTWYHVAIVRNGSNWYMFIDGVVLSSSGGINHTLPNLAGDFQIGEHITGSGDALYFKGYQDNIRITKGTALWTSNFDVDDTDAMFYTPASNGYVRPDNISGLYTVGSRGNLRGKASEGFIRPTIKQFFTSKDFEEINSLVPTTYGSVSGIMLLNNDLTIFNTGSSWRSIRSIAFQNTGKYYWEVRLDSTVDDNASVGIVTSAALPAYLGQNDQSWGFSFEGRSLHDGTAGPGGVTGVQGSIIQVALDLDSGKIFFGQNGTWIINGDPVAGTNPSFSGITGPIYAGAAVYNPAAQTTTNFGQTLFNYPVPAGFNSGFGS